MQNAVITLCCAVAIAAAVQNKDRKDPTGLPKKGDAVVLKGCLRGGALEATDVGAEEESAPLLSGMTFRLTGKKDVLKDLKKDHDGRIVEIHGKLKSDLQPQAGYGTNVGRVRVTVGAPSAGAGGPDMEAQRSLPVVEVAKFDGLGSACGR